MRAIRHAPMECDTCRETDYRTLGCSMVLFMPRFLVLNGLFYNVIFTCPARGEPTDHLRGLRYRKRHHYIYLYVLNSLVASILHSYFAVGTFRGGPIFGDYYACGACAAAVTVAISNPTKANIFFILNIYVFYKKIKVW